VGGQKAQSLAASRWVITGMGSMFRVSCKWEVGLHLGLLPITRRHLDWITWSLRQFEGYVELQTGAA